MFLYNVLFPPPQIFRDYEQINILARLLPTITQA